MIFVAFGCFGIVLKQQYCDDNDGECSRWRASKLKFSALPMMKSVRPVQRKRISDEKSEVQRRDFSINDEEGSDKNHPCVIQMVVLYVDVDEGQREMAEHVALGAREHNIIGDNGNKNEEKKTRVGANVTFIAMDGASGLDDENHMIQTILRADAIVLGSPVYNANVHPSLQRWINDNWKISDFWNDDNTETTGTTKTTIPKIRVGGAFVTAGGMTAGAESTLQRLLHILMTFQVVVVGGHDWTSSQGAAAVTAEDPFGTKRSSTKNNNHNVDNKSSTTHKSSDGMDDRRNEHSNYFPSTCYFDGGRIFGSNITSFIEDDDDDDEVMMSMPTTSIHPMFLDKAYGLGRRVASVARQLKYGPAYASFCQIDS